MTSFEYVFEILIKIKFIGILLNIFLCTCNSICLDETIESIDITHTQDCLISYQNNCTILGNILKMYFWNILDVIARSDLEDLTCVQYLHILWTEFLLDFYVLTFCHNLTTLLHSTLLWNWYLNFLEYTQDTTPLILPLYEELSF